MTLARQLSNHVTVQICATYPCIVELGLQARKLALFLILCAEYLQLVRVEATASRVSAATSSSKHSDAHLVRHLRQSVSVPLGVCGICMANIRQSAAGRCSDGGATYRVVCSWRRRCVPKRKAVRV